MIFMLAVVIIHSVHTVETILPGPVKRTLIWTKRKLATPMASNIALFTVPMLSSWNLIHISLNS